MPKRGESCQLVGDGDGKDRRNLCQKPVQVTPDLRIPKCMEMITPEDVIRRIETYYDGGSLQYQRKKSHQPTKRRKPASSIG